MTNFDSTPTFWTAKVKEDESYCYRTGLRPLYRMRILLLLLSLCSPCPKMSTSFTVFQRHILQNYAIELKSQAAVQLCMWRPKAAGFNCRICYLVNRLSINFSMVICPELANLFNASPSFKVGHYIWDDFRQSGS